MLYKDKEYALESDYIFKLVSSRMPNAKTLLDIGCGSGKHAYEMYKKGFNVTGVDLSDTMLEQAKKLPENEISFYKGDARNVRLNSDFDIVTSLFHVLSYQNSNEDVLDMLRTIKQHLSHDGVFVIDFWYGPGVLNDPPVVRKKTLVDELLTVIRIAEPTVHFDKNIVDVNYHLIAWENSEKVVSEIKEQHKMRYFFLPELYLMLETVGLRVLDIKEWMTESTPSSNTWIACIVGSHK